MLVTSSFRLTLRPVLFQPTSISYGYLRWIIKPAGSTYVIHTYLAWGASWIHKQDPLLRDCWHCTRPSFDRYSHHNVMTRTHHFYPGGFSVRAGPIFKQTKKTSKLCPYFRSEILKKKKKHDSMSCPRKDEHMMRQTRNVDYRRTLLNVNRVPHSLWLCQKSDLFIRLIQYAIAWIIIYTYIHIYIYIYMYTP